MLTHGGVFLRGLASVIKSCCLLKEFIRHRRGVEPCTGEALCPRTEAPLTQWIIKLLNECGIVSSHIDKMHF